MSVPLTPIHVFCSYALQDEEHFLQLNIHLSTLQRQNLISTWQHQQIVPGTDRGQAIDAHLESAALVLLLLSPDFLASDYCYKVEMQQAIERHNAGVARVIPIIVRPCDWNHTPLARLQSLPIDGEAITIWENRDLAWNTIVASIRRAIENLPTLATSVSHATFPAIWNVPYPRNPFFIGRDDLLVRIHTRLQAGQTTALSQPQAVSGLGGIGKTQIAIEYAYRYHREYEAVLWAGAENQEALISS